MAEKLKGSGDPDETELWYRVSLGRMLLSFEVLFFKPVLQNEWLGDGVRSFSGAFGRAECGRKDKWIRYQFLESSTKVCQHVLVGPTMKLGVKGTKTTFPQD
ncbi:hypothetical protein PV325_006145 [Microctonus aethiopoides]|nr:hypothetical protein PV325_006145 [Microctonus aethiopoides]KAK0097735.1 hypothetical protein PV326_014115 [Microctonus aethiopoides]